MSSVDIAKAEALLDKGRAHLDKGERAKAETCFRKASSISNLPAARNNWALCRYLSGDHAEALRILKPVLEVVDVAPFSRALASLAHAKLGEEKVATALLNAAIRDLDAGLADAQWRQAEVEPVP